MAWVLLKYVFSVTELARVPRQHRKYVAMLWILINLLGHTRSMHKACSWLPASLVSSGILACKKIMCLPSGNVSLAVSLTCIFRIIIVFILCGMRFALLVHYNHIPWQQLVVMSSTLNSNSKVTRKMQHIVGWTFMSSCIYVSIDVHAWCT